MSVRFIDMFILCLVWVTTCNYVLGQTTILTQNGTACISGSSFYYNGTFNKTTKNKTCLRWDVVVTNTSGYLPLDGGQHNYCRNPNNDPNGTWCYTEVNLTKDFCTLYKCNSDARAIWTGYNVVNRSAHLYALNADPEYIHQNLEATRTVNVEQYFRKSGVATELWSVASDYDSQRLFFVDYRGEYIGVHNFNTSTTKTYYDGMGHGLETLAYDPKSQNLYFTDSELNWVMATDPTFSYYSVVYSTDPDPAYALAIHVTKRLLFFSTYRNLKSKLWVSDLAGKNASVLIGYPRVDDVTGITIDYNEDRIYWTDFIGTGSVIKSSKTDGTDVQTFFTTRSSIYWSIGIYQDYVYVTDVRTRFSSDGNRQYYMFMISKIKKPVRRLLHYILRAKPRGLTVYQKINATSLPSVNPNGECSVGPKCDQVCLPGLGSKRSCACSLGYVKINETGCGIKPISNESIILADSGQGKLFHLPLDSDNSKYYILPIQYDTRIMTTAVNVPYKYLYWSDPSNGTIFRATFDGGNVTRIINGKHAKRMAIDQKSGNIYFVDDDFEYIYVTDMNGQFLKTLFKPTPERQNSSNIRDIALDVKNRFVYWTDSNRGSGKGELYRMMLDGSRPTLLYTNLSRPTGLSVDLENDKLYMAEGTLSLIYELSLTNLSAANEARIIDNSTVKYNLKSTRRPRNTFLSEIKAYNGKIYFYDLVNRSIEVFDLARGASSVTSYGPREFFRARSMTIYSVSYYNNFEAVQANICGKSLTCDQLCFAASAITGECACQDGWKFDSNSRCVVNEQAVKDTPPSVFSCDFDRIISLPPCVGSVSVSWHTPTWIDDKTPTNSLIISSPNMTSPAILSLGRHSFRFTATDEAENIGVCMFSITVETQGCGPLPPVRSDLQILQTTPKCQRSKDPLLNTSTLLIYQLSCSSGENITYGSASGQFLENHCSMIGRWKYSSFYGISCGTRPPVVIPTATTQRTTAIAPRTTANAQSTLQTTLATTRSGSTPGVVNPTTGTTATSTAREVTPTTSAKSAVKTTSTAVKTGTTTTLGPHINKGGKQRSTLSNGAIAGIVVLLVALVAIIATVLYVRSKKPGAGRSLMFWKKGEENEQLRENVFDDVNHYTVL